MALVLQNNLLSASFVESTHGPRLQCIRHAATGEIFAFDHADEIGLVVLSPQEKDNPQLEVRYATQDQFTFAGQNGLESRWTSPRVTVTATYELATDAPALRKTIRCTAGTAPVYIAGVRHWTLQPNHAIAWPPPEEPSLQPVVLFGKRGGLMATLEWSWTQLTREGNGFALEFRPGFMLEPGQTREVTAGSLICFEGCALEAARQVFFAHLAQRIQPKAPRPIKFTTWGPWLGQVSAARIHEIAADLQEVGTDLLHIDAGWLTPEFPYSQHLPRVRGASDREWDREMVLADRFPNGLLPMRELAEQHRMKLSLWFDTCGDVFIKEGETWAVREANGEPVLAGTWEGRWRKAPKQSLASEYGERLLELALQAFRRYDLHGVVFDNHYYHIDHATGRQSMANGWNAKTVQHRIALEILDHFPGIYRFYCESDSFPWVLLHASHLHASDPSITKDFARATTTDYPLRCLAFERRHAWRRHYNNFVPPWGVKGDIAGWSVQQRSAIPLNLAHTDRVPGSGEGWTQNMFTCFATTIHRDIRFAFRQMPDFDKHILKEWLAWDRQHARFAMNARPLTPAQTDPDQGVEVITQITDGKGVLYLFNQSFTRAEAEITFDEQAGFRPEDKDIPACLVYPLRAPVGSVSYNQTLKIPLIAKDCAVIEFDLDTPTTATYADYWRATEIVQRSFEPIFLTNLSGKSFRVEAGQTPTDRHLASQIVATLGCVAGTTGQRLIIGTFDGLRHHPDVGRCFRETFYDRYIEWEGRLISAPLVAALPDFTICLIAPRPEQLARLGIRLAADRLAAARTVWTLEETKELRSKIEFDAAIPTGRPVLRFRPTNRRSPNVCPIPEDLDLIRYTITAGNRTLWDEEVPPFLGQPWWDDRLISLAEFAGQTVRFNLTATGSSPMYAVGFDHVAIVALS